VAFLFDFDLVTGLLGLDLHVFHLLELKVDVANALGEVLQMIAIGSLLVFDCLPSVLLLDDVGWHLLGLCCFFFSLSSLLVGFLALSNHVVECRSTLLISDDVSDVND